MYISIFQPAADGGAPQTRVAQHTAMPFGAVGAVHGYQRLSEALTHIGIYLGGLLIMHCVDDFRVLDAASCAWSGFRTFHGLMRLLGFQLEPKKTTRPAAKVELLGMQLRPSAELGGPY